MGAFHSAVVAFKINFSVRILYGLRYIPFILLTKSQVPYSMFFPLDTPTLSQFKPVFQDLGACGLADMQ